MILRCHSCSSYCFFLVFLSLPCAFSIPMSRILTVVPFSPGPPPGYRSLLSPLCHDPDALLGLLLCQSADFWGLEVNTVIMSPNVTVLTPRASFQGVLLTCLTPGLSWHGCFMGQLHLTDSCILSWPTLPSPSSCSFPAASLSALFFCNAFGYILMVLAVRMGFPLPSAFYYPHWSDDFPFQ